jgi:GNAT superfamily N-acetyltransferase
MAFEGDRPVATAGFFLDGEYAWIDFASTHADYRGRGAQGALVEQRIRDAKDMGCKWLVVETAQQTPEKEAPSYRNMIRYGFKLAYTRPNYIFEF